MNFLKTSTAAITSIMAGLAMMTAASAETYRLSHNTGDTTTWHRGADKFNELIQEATNGEIEIRTFPNAQLSGGDQMRQAEMVGRGALDFVITSAINVTPLAPEMAVFSLPYLYSSYEEVDRTTDGAPGERMKEIMLDHNIVVLAWGENGFREVTNSRHPITKPEDLQGIKLRTPKGVWRVKMFQAYGATPSPMALSEVFVALQTGVMDGQENPFAQIYPSRFQEVQKYLSLTGHVYTPAYLTAGASWDRLPDDVRSALEETATEMEPVALEIAARLDTELLGKLKEAGMEVNEADKPAFIEASKPIYEEFAKEVSGGQELIDKALSLASGS